MTREGGARCRHCLHHRHVFFFYTSYSPKFISTEYNHSVLSSRSRAFTVASPVFCRATPAHWPVGPPPPIAPQLWPSSSGPGSGLVL
ncbi:hypothetical protein EYF80_030159 [Liparis tanakae]|uniref:Uncharacterized protein n=1 Tax=Liparis tanakae TaxID=230148 RepID=A0A4Z2H135_9TELE|nr:hypothetical protein EYF80_030159 [Liparis tanakae]